MHRDRKPKYDLEQVRTAATGRWPQIITSLASTSPDLLDGHHHPCPLCKGTDRFRVFDDFAHSGGMICNQCFSRKNSDGFAALQWLLKLKFPEAVIQVAEFLGVAPLDGRAAATATASSRLQFLPDNPILLSLFCDRKPPITPPSIQAIGGRLARYRNQYTVLAIPVVDQDGRSTGWVALNATGPALPIYRDKQISEWKKVKLLYGSESGVIGDLAAIRAAATVWKVEGPTDLLALISAGLPPGHAAFTTAAGAKENPGKFPWLIELLAGKQVNVVHDCDRPGQDGATYVGDDDRPRPGWAPVIATKAISCKNVVLPYPISDVHGKDLRDWLIEGHAVDELLLLAEKSEPVSPAAPSLRILEHNDDAHRLARLNLEQYAAQHGGRTLRFWRDEWLVWKDNRYQRISEKELRAKVTQFVRLEFERINIEEQQEYEEKKRLGEITEENDKGPPRIQKITQQLVGSVLQASMGMVVLSSDLELGTWLPTKRRLPYVSLANGLLDVDRLLADRDDYMQENTPDWFSMASLPYEFDPEAKCPKWEAFLEHNMEMDPERIKVLQEWAGYLLLPDTGEQRFMVLEGEGANGKSVYIAAITAMLGEENVSTVPLEVFGDRFSRTDTLGKLLNAAGDCAELDRVAEGYIKSFTGGDRMFFDRKGVSGINCRPTARLMLACNNRPRFSDRSQGVWRRLLLIPWQVEITREKRIKGMDKVEWWRDQGELPGILNWALAGLYRLRNQGGFTDCQKMNEAITDYQEEVNPTRAFLVQFIERNTIITGIRSADLYSVYRSWAQENGYHPVAERTFGKEVKRVFPFAERKFLGARGDRYYIYHNLGFNTEEICGRHVKNFEEI